MGRYVASELRRALCSPVFIGLIILTTAGLVLWSQPMKLDGQTAGWVWLLQFTIGQSPLALLAPLLATLPFAQSYAAERNSGFSRLVMQRQSVTSYRRVKLVSTTLSGGLAVGLPVAALALWFSWQYPARFGDSYQIYLFGDRVAAQSAGSAGLLIAVCFCFGAAFAILGLSASTLFRNPFYANVVPFAAYIIGTFLVALAALALGIDALIAWEPTAMWDGSIADAVSPTSVLLQYVLVVVGSILVYVRFFRHREE